MNKVLTIIFFLSVMTSRAQTLEDYLTIAEQNNPELRANYNDYEAAQEQVPQVGALEDPVLGVGLFIPPMQLLMGNQVAEFQLMQMFPWFGTLGTRRGEVRNMARAQYQSYIYAKNQLFRDVKISWYELYRLKEQVRIAEENLEILERYERLALSRFGSGGAGGEMQGGSMSDVLRVKLEINELENQLAFLTESRGPLIAEFNQLLNRDHNVPVNIADTLLGIMLTVNHLAILDTIIYNNPQLKMLDAESEVYESRKRLARLSGRPSFGAGINYMLFNPRQENGMAMGGGDMIMPMVNVSIPIYRRKYNAMVNEAELRQEAVVQRKENTKNRLVVQWGSLIRDLNDATRRTELYQNQTKIAKQTLNLLLTSYATDGRFFEEVLRMQQQLLEYQLNLINSIVDQHQVVARLEELATADLL
jgi:outer membrane protein TolC